MASPAGGRPADGEGCRERWHQGAAAFANVLPNPARAASTLTLTVGAGRASSDGCAMRVVDIAARALGPVDPPIVNRPPAGGP